MPTCRVAVILIVLAAVFLPGTLAVAQTANPLREPKAPAVFDTATYFGHAESPRMLPQPADTALDDRSPNPVQQTQYASALDQQPGDSLSETPIPDGFDTLAEPISNSPIWEETAVCGPGPWLRPDWPHSANAWASAEGLLWWTSGMQVPALATTSPNGTLANQAGVLGQPGTTILFGNDSLDDDARWGGRFTIGGWLDSCHCQGLEVTYLMLASESQSFTGSSNDFSILARPFFNVQTNAQDAQRIVFPGELTGNLAINTSTDFQAFEAVYRLVGRDTPCQHVNYLVGYRFAHLEDEVGVGQLSQVLSGPIAGSTIDLSDAFNTRNSFNGGELGIVMECQQDACWSWEVLAKVALGSTNSQASISGATTTTSVAGGAATTQSGLLAQSTNIGVYEQSALSTVSELGVTLRRRLNCGLSGSVGYTFMYWSNVVRAGEEIDVGVNASQIPGMLTGSPRPAFSFDETDFWAQGLRLGLEFAY